jgi:hypothetical protein
MGQRVRMEIGDWLKNEEIVVPLDGWTAGQRIDTRPDQTKAMFQSREINFNSFLATFSHL